MTSVVYSVQIGKPSTNNFQQLEYIPPQLVYFRHRRNEEGQLVATTTVPDYVLMQAKKAVEKLKLQQEMMQAKQEPVDEMPVEEEAPPVDEQPPVAAAARQPEPEQNAAPEQPAAAPARDIEIMDLTLDTSSDEEDAKDKKPAARKRVG